MAEAATGIVLIAGGMTFANEWYQTGKADFKVLVATAFGAALMDGLAQVTKQPNGKPGKAAIGLAIMVLIAALSTRFDGKSAIDTLVEWFGKKGTKKPVHHARRKAA